MEQSKQFSETPRVTLIAGDGIGPEITAATIAVLDAAGAKLVYVPGVAGLSALESCGSPLPQATVDSIRDTGLALKGPLATPSGGGYRSINVTLRQEFDLYANIRPIRTIVPGRYDNVDLVIFRENTEDCYTGIEHDVMVPSGRGVERLAAESIAVITAAGSRRIVRAAFEYAVQHGRKRVTLVHKANILKRTQGLFLETGRRVASEFSGVVQYDERIVDAAGMDLVVRPESLDVLVMTNLHGDILSDVAAGLVGGLGLAPGMNIGSSAAMFEAVHGTAPDIAGKGIANPTAMLLAACLLLEHVGQGDVAQRIRTAVHSTLNTAGVRTRDLGGNASTAAYSEAICAGIR